ncbi:uncharacterized protein LOC135695808 [Rhopilema esculentum]|uniref:uncharacterized protein LOC135695808 n=1 Tax=Rhopilema esculentum TaxID=499914 RepID=UPI0031E1E69B|eukprot:gene5348-522_t
MKKRLNIIILFFSTILLPALPIEDSESSASKGPKFLEYFNFLQSDNTLLSRRKRISDLVTDNDHRSQQLPSSEYAGDQSPSTVTERSVDANSRNSKVVLPNIVTISSNVVPNDDDDSGDADQAESGNNAKNFNPNEKVIVDSADILWPKGRYGLPRTIHGCPVSKGFVWKEGYRYHDTEDDGTENEHSDNFHLASNFTEDGIRHEFCIKDSDIGDSEWPPGKYCIYKKGPECPGSMIEGFVIWDDENTDNQNERGGALPEGLYSDDTKIYFCCQTEGAVNKPIELPTEKDFLLFSFQSTKCQKVRNMKSSSEFLKFDDEDHGNIDYEGGAYPYGIHKAQKDHMLFLCYYEPDNKALSGKARPLQKEANRGREHGENDAASEDQRALQKSEEMMKAFLTATGGEEDELNKSERTRTIIKTIKVPVKSKSYPIAIIVGLVLGGVVVSSTIIVLAKYIVNRQYIDQSSLNMVETNWTQPDGSNMIDVESDDDFSMGGSEVGENEMDELVEDQLLPDSELKTGLELMFLKQQRHYWNQRQRKDRPKSHEM